jgi:hypothetical protein
VVDGAGERAAGALAEADQACAAVVRHAVVKSADALRREVVQVFVHGVGPHVAASTNRVHLSEHVLVAILSKRGGIAATLCSG